MATVPEGYVELDLVGFTDKGTYSSSETYVKNDLVHNDNKIYLSLQDDNIGQALPSSTETENTYWKVWLAGSADDLANITVKDTSNVTGGGANKVVVAQNLIDAIANKVIQNMNSITQLNSNLNNGKMMRAYSTAFVFGKTIPGNSTDNQFDLNIASLGLPGKPSYLSLIPSTAPISNIRYDYDNSSPDIAKIIFDNNGGEINADSYVRFSIIVSA